MATLEKLSEEVTDAGRRTVYGVRKPKPAAPTPTPPEPVKPEFGPHQLQPPEDAITTRATAHCGDREAATAQLVSEKREQLRRLSKVMPERAADIREELRNAEVERLSALAALATATDTANSAADLLTARAGTRREARDAQAALDAAKTALDSPDSLKLDGPTLALLVQKSKHLPAKVKELQQREAELTARLAALDGIDLARLLTAEI